MVKCRKLVKISHSESCFMICNKYKMFPKYIYESFPQLRVDVLLEVFIQCRNLECRLRENRIYFLNGVFLVYLCDKYLCFHTVNTISFYVLQRFIKHTPSEDTQQSHRNKEAAVSLECVPGMLFLRS